MEIFTFLGPLLAKLQDPAVLVPTAAFIYSMYLHVVWRREEREDRAKMLEAFNNLSEALYGVKEALAASTGKVA